MIHRLNICAICKEQLHDVEMPSPGRSGKRSRTVLKVGGARSSRIAGLVGILQSSPEEGRFDTHTTHTHLVRSIDSNLGFFQRCSNLIQVAVESGPDEVCVVQGIDRRRSNIKAGYDGRNLPY